MAFRNNSVKKTALYKWYSKFEQGNNSVLMNRAQAAPHPSQQRKLKQSKSRWTLIVERILDNYLRYYD